MRYELSFLVSHCTDLCVKAGSFVQRRLLGRHAGDKFCRDISGERLSKSKRRSIVSELK